MTEFICNHCQDVLPVRHEAWQEPDVCRRCYCELHPQRRPTAVGLVLVIGLAFALVLWWVTP